MPPSRGCTMESVALDEPHARRQKRSDTGVLPTTGSSLVWPARSKSNTCHGNELSVCRLCHSDAKGVRYPSFGTKKVWSDTRQSPRQNKGGQAAQLEHACLPLQQAPARTAGNYHRQTIAAGQCRSFQWHELLPFPFTASPAGCTTISKNNLQAGCGGEAVIDASCDCACSQERSNRAERYRSRYGRLLEGGHVGQDQLRSQAKLCER